MEIVTRGLFKFDPNKTYVLIDEKKNEYGSLEVVDETIVAVLNESEEVVFNNSDELSKWLDEKNYIISSDSVRWVKYNPNPKGKMVNDCSIRAYCAAENLKWDDAYDIAASLGKANAMMPNDAANCKYVIQNEFGYTFHKLNKDQKEITVNSFAINHPKGTYILSITSHLVAVIDGEYYDSWDSGKKKIKGYYSKD